ncbi:MAG: RecX family transcriptional regulator [Oscillospiraceae bacterium]|jgi:regulatory protein|nr:RecX family transcriptional regulator [Oscillospiraceae bacterium]
MIITNIVKGKRDNNLVFADGNYAFSADEETLFKNKLYVGSSIDLDLISKIEFEANEHKSKEKAFRLLSYRNHSKKELINKIKNKYDEESANSAVNKMEKLGLINDRKFAMEHALHLFKKFYSIKRVKFELLKKGIDKDTVFEVIEEISPDEKNQIICLLDKKYSKKMNSEENIKKISLSLQNLGYSFADINSAILFYTEKTI